MEKGSGRMVKTLPENVMRAIRLYRKLEPDDTSEDSIILSMGLYNVLNSFLSWEGVYGYTSELVAIAHFFGAENADRK
jgi:hypothetical protein